MGVFDLDVLREGIPNGAYAPVTGDDKKIADAFRNQNKQEREGQLRLFGLPALPQTDALADLMRRFAREREETPDGDQLHHPDQSSQYTSTLVQTLLAEYHVQVSMNGVGNCYNDAPMESFIGTL